MSADVITPHIPSSFRDPSGFLFKHASVLLRQVNTTYADNYNQLMTSGLYRDLVDSGLLVQHKEVQEPPALPQVAYRVLQPECVPFISYPDEWSFSQLKDAALTTLTVARKALEYDMVLKDASAFNVQFLRGRPIFIDTLSFEKYHEGSPWVAYKQFCQHFLAPLALMTYTDVRLNQLFRIYIDGIPLDLASTLLPASTKLKFALLSHIHLHSKSQKKFGDKPIEVGKHHISKHAFLGLLDNLQSAVGAMQWHPAGTEWGEYYEATNYSDSAFEQKKRLVGEFLTEANPSLVWDLGSNTGVFSRIASSRGITTVSFDVDPDAVERNYRQARADNEESILPLVMDLTNPSAGRGWHNRERNSLVERGPADVAMALALVHHLAISNNVPLDMIAEFFSDLCSYFIIEFVPKSDSQVQRLLTTREDIFPEYTQNGFEERFSLYFEILRSVPIKGSDRVLYLMKKR